MTDPDPRERRGRRGPIRYLAGKRLRLREGLTLRAMVPNAITLAALCCGLSGVRFALAEQWPLAAGAIVLAGVLDGIDGRVARLLKAQSRFGAELDSLADNIAFGVSPALVLFLWSLGDLPRFGWLVALALAICCALRLARFNAQIDMEDQPHKSAGYMTGVPAPAGAGLAMLPLYLWMETGIDVLRSYAVVGPWVLLVAFLMISNVATFSWSSLRLRKNIRLEALAIFALVAGALLTVPWVTLSAISIVYLALIPFGIRSYARIRRQRASRKG
ncbi:phosphatidylcholine/phosphatidylserine synthase [Blastomonas sp.]|uniref:CDP-alcohol phosphatidyltransferase family protein n=1 Tax=Blastomonas sp. TaxID=1909299 RepID=UPI00359405E7